MRKENTAFFVLLHIQYFTAPSGHPLQQWNVSPAAICHGVNISNPSAGDGAPDIKALHRAPSCRRDSVSWNRFRQPLFRVLSNLNEETIWPLEQCVYPHGVEDVTVMLFLIAFNQSSNNPNLWQTCPFRLSPLCSALLTCLLYLVHNLATVLATYLTWLAVTGANGGRGTGGRQG